MGLWGLSGVGNAEWGQDRDGAGGGQVTGSELKPSKLSPASEREKSCKSSPEVKGMITTHLQTLTLKPALNFPTAWPVPEP